MTQPAFAALHAALALLQAPRGPRPSEEQRLPGGMSLLLRLAAGEEDASQAARAESGETAQTVREAAIFYLQQVCFASGGSSYRVLGVDPDAGDERIREHYRWLARWLHPDRNPDEWEVVFAERVGQAWQDLRTPERRHRYDTSLLTHDDWSSVVAAPPVQREPPRRRRRVSRERAKPGRDLRWIPSAAVAALGAGTLGLLVLFYASRQPTQPVLVARAPAVADQTVPRRAPRPPEATLEPVVQAPALPPSVAPIPQPVPVMPPGATPTALSAPLAMVAPAAATPRETPREEPAKLARPEAQDVPEPAKARRATAMASEPVPRQAVLRQPVEPAPVQAASLDVGAHDANRVLGNLSHAYEDGDLHRMRALFAADAHGPRGGLDSILAEYDRVFAGTRERSLSVRDVNWFRSGDTFTIIASFEATVTSTRTGRPRRSRGDLRLDLRREGEQWQIYRMQHDEKQG